MMGTKREDSKISGSSQKQIQKKLHTKEGAKKGGFDDALKNFWKPSEREDEGKQSEREREENNQPKGYSEDAGNNNKTGKTSHRSLKQATERGSSTPQVKQKMSSSRRERETNKEANEEVGGRRRRRRKAREL
jgi:hypothetical protein